MKWKNVAFMAVVSVFILSGSAMSQQWVDVKNAKELRTLHSNKTFKMTDDGVPVVEHYRVDGKGIVVRVGRAADEIRRVVRTRPARVPKAILARCEWSVCAAGQPVYQTADERADLVAIVDGTVEIYSRFGIGDNPLLHLAHEGF